ncbi:MAG: head-tail connector protein [Pseudomonadota bacterium]
MILTEQTTVPLSALPVAVFKDHLRLGSGFSDDGVQDGLLEGYLRAATAAIEARTGKILIERTFTWTLTDWRDDRQQPLPLAPVSAMTEMTLIDGVGGETAVDPLTWRLVPDAHRPQVQPRGACLPTIPQGGGVRLGLLVGFGPEWEDLPADLAQAVLLLAAHFYEFRHDVARSAPQLPPSVQALIASYRTVRTFIGGRS